MFPVHNVRSSGRTVYDDKHENLERQKTQWMWGIKIRECGFEVSMAVSNKIVALWALTMCSFMDGYGRFGQTVVKPESQTATRNGYLPNMM